MRSRLILILAVLVAFLAPVSGADAFETTAKAAIIIDYRTGAVLFEKNADERMPPASARLASVQLECMPALDVIGRYGRAPEVLLYVDPPYLSSTRRSLQYVTSVQK